jgi:hypothetical protein
MRLRPLPSQDYLRECFDYHPETGELIRKWRPRRHFSSDRSWEQVNRWAGCACTARDKFGHTTLGFDGCTTVYAHRIIWKWMTGEEPPPGIDHRDTDPANNRWGNLRPATQSQNIANGRPQARATARGVYWRPDNRWNKWVSVIRKDSHLHYLGSFPTEAQAAEAYVEAAKRLHGEYAHQP